jgi:hypothetical protein
MRRLCTSRPSAARRDIIHINAAPTSGAQIHVACSSHIQIPSRIKRFCATMTDTQRIRAISVEGSGRRKKKPHTFTAYVEFDPATKLYVGTVPVCQAPTASAPLLTTGVTTLREVIALILEAKTAQPAAECRTLRRHPADCGGGMRGCVSLMRTGWTNYFALWDSKRCARKAAISFTAIPMAGMTTVPRQQRPQPCAPTNP